MHYVSQSGWNETMNDFARHQRFKGKWAQEGMRFLQFQGQRPREFRRHIFTRAIEHYLLFFSSIMVTAIALIISFSVGVKESLILISVYAASIGVYSLIVMLYKRFKKPPLPDTPPQSGDTPAK